MLPCVAAVLPFAEDAHLTYPLCKTLGCGYATKLRLGVFGVTQRLYFVIDDGLEQLMFLVFSHELTVPLLFLLLALLKELQDSLFMTIMCLGCSHYAFF